MLVKLHPAEIERRIFIPGHRFEPFRPDDVEPSALIVSDGDGVPLQRSKIALGLKTVELFYTIFGTDEYLFHLAAEDENNSDVMMRCIGNNDDGIVRVSVFKLDPLFPKGIPDNAYLELTLENAKKGRFVVRPVQAEDERFKLRDSWFKAMDKAFEGAIEALGIPQDNSTLILNAFEKGGEALYANPAGSLSEYVNAGRVLAFMDYAGFTVLWKKGVNPADFRLSSAEPSQTKKKRRHGPGKGTLRDRLDELLTELGYSLNSAEMEAIYLDSLYRAVPFEDILRTYFLESPQMSLGVEIKEQLLPALVELYAEIAQGYRRKEDLYGEERKLMVAIATDFIKWMRGLEDLVDSTDELPMEEFTELSRVMQGVYMGMMLLNTPLSTMNAKEKKDMAESVSAITEIMPELWSHALDIQKGLEGMLLSKKSGASKIGISRRGAGKKSARSSGGPKPDKSKSGRSKKPTGRSPSKNIYTLEIRIEDIRPMVKRVIEVPGNRTLAELHNIIQAAFFWYNSHLHSWTIRKEEYGPPTEDNYGDCLDEREYTLDDFDLAPKNTFRYTYDFGDDWVHSVKVKKVQPCVDQPQQVRCVSGMRKGPPEDFGGAWSYTKFLEDRLQDNPQSQDLKEVLEYYSDWDPEDFDLDEVNAALRNF